MDLGHEKNNGKFETIEDLFSEEDKKKIGIGLHNYNTEKGRYSFEFYMKIKNNLEKMNKETMKNFDNLFELLNSE